MSIRQFFHAQKKNDTNFLRPSYAGYYLKYIEYVVWYRQTDAPEWRTMRILSPTAMEATITHLEPNHEYEFMVLSQDRYGEGMFSRAFKYFTRRN